MKGIRIRGVRLIEAPFEEFWSLHRENEARKQMLRELPDDLDYSSFFEFQPDKKDSILNREILSILRSDLTILTSDYEQKYLEEHFDLPNLVTIPFFYFKNPLDEKTLFKQKMQENKFFQIRKHLVWLGNFHNFPNHVLQLTPVHHRIPRLQNLPPSQERTGPVHRTASLRLQFPQKVPRLGPGGKWRPAHGPHEIAEFDDPL